MRDLILSHAETATTPDRIEMLFYFDRDDPELVKLVEEVKRVKTKVGFQRLEFGVGAPIGVSLTWNKLFKASRGQVIMIINDGLRMQTKGWDTRLDEERRKFPDDIYCMGFNDGRVPDKFFAFPIVRRRWCFELGYLMPIFLSSA